MKKKWILNFLKIFGVTGLVILIFVAGYVYTTIHGLKLKLAETKIRKAEIAQSASYLEKDTQVSAQLFKSYLLFAEDGELRTAEEYLFQGIISKRHDKFDLLEEVELPRLRSNNCSRIFCIQNREDFPSIPSSIWKGLLGTEDFRFLEHRGIDPIAIARAIVVDVIAMKFVQGGSTLTQQLVKNLFLTSERKIKRKIIEVIYAIYIENIMDKDEIITLYLNEVFWGTYQGIYLKGFYSASIAYFGKRPKELDDFEATILVSLLKGPNFYHPVRGLKNLMPRALSVYKRLEGLKLVSSDSSIIWDEKKWNEWSQKFNERSEGSDFRSYYSASKNGEKFLESYEKLALFESVSSVKKYLSKRVKGADVGIKILIANKDCESYDCESIFTYYSKTEREKRSAITSEAHQVGSLLKPIVYESFIEEGRSYDEDISTAPISIQLKSGVWRPKDYSKVKVATVKLKEALQKSKNIPLVRVASEIGFDILEKNLDKKIPKLKKPLAEYPAQLLGAHELSLEDVMITYSSFIKNKCLQIKQNKEVFEKTVLHYMSVARETTISRVAKAPLKEAYVFGKTGTSNNGLDNWYFAFDGKNIYVIWYGIETNRDKTNLKLSGAISSYLIFQNFMNFRGKQISEIICN